MLTGVPSFGRDCSVLVNDSHDGRCWQTYTSFYSPPIPKPSLRAREILGNSKTRCGRARESELSAVAHTNFDDIADLWISTAIVAGAAVLVGLALFGLPVIAKAPILVNDGFVLVFASSSISEDRSCSVSPIRAAFDFVEAAHPVTANATAIAKRLIRMGTSGPRILPRRTSRGGLLARNARYLRATEAQRTNWAQALEFPTFSRRVSSSQWCLAGCPRTIFARRAAPRVRRVCRRGSA